jgi:hypothetical protein
MRRFMSEGSNELNGCQHVDGAFFGKRRWQNSLQRVQFTFQPTDSVQEIRQMTIVS